MYLCINCCVFDDLGMFKVSKLVCFRILGCLTFQNLHFQDIGDVWIFIFCVFEDLGMFKFSNLVCLRILGCSNFQNWHFQLLLMILGCLNFQKENTCLRFLSICLIPNWCLGTLSVLFWCQTKVFGVSPSPPLSPHPPSVSDGPRFVSDTRRGSQR